MGRIAKYTLSLFIEKAKLAHKNNYDYSLIKPEDIKGWDGKLNIKCNYCENIFSQSLGKHISGRGCPKCKSRKISEARKYTLEEIKIKIKEKFPDYNLNLIKEYKSIYDKPLIVCKKHGMFSNRTFNQLKNGEGCVLCNKENNEKQNKKEISIIYTNEYPDNIEYRQEYLNLLKKAKENIPEKYEIHHILPKSMFPNWKNKEINLIKLSIEDHYRAHYLLYKIYNNKEMAQAFLLMLKITGKKYNPELYKEIKNNFNNSVKIYCYELNKTFESLVKARTELGISSFHNSLKDWTKTTCSKHWCYLEDKEEAVKFWKNGLVSKYKSIYCYELNKQYDKIVDAERELNGKLHLENAKKKKFNSLSLGYHWCYLEDKEEAIKFWKNNIKNIEKVNNKFKYVY